MVRFGKLRELILESTKATNGIIGNLQDKDKPMRNTFNQMFGYVQGTSITQLITTRVETNGTIASVQSIPNTTTYVTPSNDTGITGILIYFVN